MAEDDLVASLEAAVAAAPADAALRLHLGELLCQRGAGPRALEHAVHVLTEQPSHLAALAVAARAADLCGFTERAAAYRTLLRSLGGDPAVPEVAAGGDDPVPVGVTETPTDDWDAFLREVIEEADADIERPAITLADVGGLSAVKSRLETSFLGPLRNPQLRRMYGKSLRGGLLLYGPPGCGKTFLARALAGEIGARFFAVGLHDVLDMWLGKSEQNLHTIFETARRHAPCVLFLDEVDALGMKRSNLSHSAGRNVVVQLLSELDSTRADNEGVFVLGATNQPWDLDPALRRPGRFDRILLVLPPDADARVAILRFHLKERPVGGVDVAGIAGRTDGYSGADLRLLCEDAAERALADSITSGDARPIVQADFERALQHVHASTRPWFDAARSFVMFANQGGEYDDLLGYMRQNRLT